MTPRVVTPRERAQTRPPLPPFTRDTAIQKVRAAEDGWNTRDPELVALAYSAQSRWRNRAEWFRSFGNENWEFDAQGLMTARHASINDLPIREEDRKFRWRLGRRPDDHPGLSSFGF